MKLQLDTPNRTAFDRYTEALSCIEVYRSSGNRSLVDKSEVLLDEACDADPQWVRPLYLKSVIKDLAGNPDAAIHELERFERTAEPPFALEIKYNLGAAHYHRYREPHLTQAEGLFDEVKINAADTLQPLSLLASSALAQVYAMRVLLKQPERRQELMPQAREWYERCTSEAESTLKRLETWKRSKSFSAKSGHSSIADEIEWAATNALGFVASFWSDYLDPRLRIPLLKESIAVFEKGLRLRPNHWASLSNLASAKMRLGYALRIAGDPSEGAGRLGEALETIDLVLSPDVRPNYAFALYERGRILRLMGRFKDAAESLAKVSALPNELRDVSEKTIDAELARAGAEDDSFL